MQDRIPSSNSCILLIKTIPFKLSFAIGLLHDSIYCPDGEILNLISNNNRENN